MNKYEVKTTGMMCEGCENRMKKALMSIQEIEDVSADYKTGLVQVSSKKKINEEEINNKITKLGFEIVKED